MNLIEKMARVAEKHTNTSNVKNRGINKAQTQHINCILPYWSDNSRAVPNGFLRSALFGVNGKKGERKFLKSVPIAALNGIEIYYTGEQLDQSDLDVWQNILHVMRNQELDRHCCISAYALLKLSGITDTGKNRNTLFARIERLRANSLRITQGRHAYIGGLIDEAYKDDATNKWIISLNSRLLHLFSSDQYTQVDWNVRRALSQNSLAQWLDGFYSSHSYPFRIKVETLHKLCGSQIVRVYHFRDELKKALNLVVSIRKENGYTFEFEIDHNDLVNVKKTRIKRPK